MLREVYQVSHTARKEPKYGVFPAPYFPIFSPNTGKYGPEKNPYFGTFYTMSFVCLARSKTALIKLNNI